MNNAVKKTLLALLIATMLIAPSMTLMQVHADGPSPPAFDLRGTWSFDDIWYGDYYHSMTISSINPATGDFSGTGYYPLNSNTHVYEWTIAGKEQGNEISFTLRLTYPTDETWITLVGTGSVSLDISGTLVMSGTGFQNNLPPYTDDSTPNVAWAARLISQSSVDLSLPEGITATVIGTSAPPIYNFGGGDSGSAVAAPLPPPSGWVQLPPLPGIIGFYYDVSVSAPITGQVQVCVHYDPDLLPLGTDPKNLRLFIGDPVDFNGDGTVNGQDIALMQGAIKNGVYNPRYDINHDGNVDKADLLIVKQFASHGLIVNQGQNGLSQARLPWLDITTYVDTTNYYVYGVTDHFSGFAIH